MASISANFQVFLIFIAAFARPAPLLATEKEPSFELALQRLLVEPHFDSAHLDSAHFDSDSRKPYTHAIEDDLFKVYNEEQRAANLATREVKDKVERIRQISLIFQRENAKVKAQLRSSALAAAPTLQDRFIALEAYNELRMNPMTNEKALERYDPKEEVGYCFGRSAFVHDYLLRQKVPQEKIAKIYAFSSLKQGYKIWDYHMATMIPGTAGEWLVIDNLFERVLPHEEWMKRVTALDLKKKNSHIRFYVTDPRKFQPGFLAYQADYFNLKELKVYFHDLFALNRGQPAQVVRSRRSPPI